VAFTSIGLLHPGEMGAGIGATLVSAGHRVSWASSGRGASSARRAAAAGLFDVHSVEAMTESCDLIVSVCPPSAALDVARQVAGFGFDGTYLDANAIAPATAREVAAVLEQAGGRSVDGGIIGPPPSPSSSPRLYLSGPSAPPVRDLFAGTAVEAQVISEDQSAASALKMCFAAWTKGTTALLLDVRALALAEGVEGPLLAEWEHSLPDLAGRSLQSAQQAATKGWRWVGEMDQIAATFRSAGLPDGFHRAAAEVYARPERDEAAVADAVTLENVLHALLEGHGRE
jgi:3-hydroxyisobutyrate dehydrogenase-like beta-hydroxyacid dehydrogenase